MFSRRNKPEAAEPPPFTLVIPNHDAAADVARVQAEKALDAGDMPDARRWLRIFLEQIKPKLPGPRRVGLDWCVRHTAAFPPLHDIRDFAQGELEPYLEADRLEAARRAAEHDAPERDLVPTIRRFLKRSFGLNL